MQSCDESEKRQSLKCDEKWILSEDHKWPTISAKFQSWVNKIMIMKRYKKNKKSAYCDIFENISETLLPSFFPPI